MAISPFSAVSTACEESGWSLTNLHAQKLLYFAHKTYLGRTNDPLVNEEFEAWDLGPVLPSLYAELRQFGSATISDIRNVKRNLSRPEHKVIQEIIKHFRGVPAWKLVDLAHKPGGAWATHYVPGSRGITIPDKDILTEYRRENHA